MLDDFDVKQTASHPSNEVHHIQGRLHSCALNHEPARQHKVFELQEVEQLLQVVAWERELVQVGLVVNEQVELKGFQALEEAEGVLEEEEAKEQHFDPEPGRQLEDVEVDWDTGRKKKKIL